MKKFLCMLIALSMFSVSMFAATYKATVKGEVFIKTEDGEMIQLEEEDSITDDDVIIIIEEKASVTFYVDDIKCIIRKPGTYKIADIVKKAR